VVYRFGHSMLTENIDRLNLLLGTEGGEATGVEMDNVGLIDAFLNPVAYAASGVDSEAAAGAILRGMSRQVGNEIDEFLTDALRNNLVGLPLDLATVNMTRARETGVPSLNAARREFYAETQDTYLKPYESWFEFALAIKNPASLVNFIAAYGTHATILAATTVEVKRDAAMLLVLGGTGSPADRLDFLNSTGAWANGPNGVTITGLEHVLSPAWIGIEVVDAVVAEARREHERVAVVAAPHPVVAGATGDHVVAVAAFEPVVARSARHGVVGIVALAVEVARAGVLQVLQVAAEAVGGERGLDRICAFAPLLDHAVVPVVDDVGIVAAAAGHAVLALAAAQGDLPALRWPASIKSTSITRGRSICPWRPPVRG